MRATEARSSHVLWQESGKARIAARRRHSVVLLDACHVWGFEARDRLCYVHSLHGCFDVDASLLELETALGRAFLRVHRRWLVHVANIRVFEWRRRAYWLLVGSGLGRDDPRVRVPVAREHASTVRQLLLAGTIGYPGRRSTAGLGGHPLHPVSM
jgi:DNA-binding LytR/AlgR family response regulator